MYEERWFCGVVFRVAQEWFGTWAALVGVEASLVAAAVRGRVGVLMLTD